MMLIKVLNRIQKIRWEMNISQKDLADQAGISKSYICMLENGQRVPTQITIMKISKALGLKAHEIFILDFDDIVDD